jgi:hypothetical protein
MAAAAKTENGESGVAAIAAKPEEMKIMWLNNQRHQRK